MYTYLYRHLGPRGALVVTSTVYALMLALIFFYSFESEATFNYLVL